MRNVHPFAAIVREDSVVEDLGGYDDEVEELDAGEAQVIRDYVVEKNLTPDSFGEIRVHGREVYDRLTAYRSWNR